MTDSPVEVPQRSSGRLKLAVGIAFALLGIPLFIVQLSFERLFVPWYAPILASLGAVLIAISLRRRRTVWRGLAFVAVILLAGFEWATLYGLRLPPYHGPLAAGRPFPAFEAKRADGTAFTLNDLADGQNHILVFFRGHW